MSNDGQRARSARLVRSGWPAWRILPATAAVVVLAAACTSSKPAASSGTSKSSAGSSTTVAAGSTSAPAAAGGVPSSTPSPSSTSKAPKKDIIAGLIAFDGKLSFSGAQRVGMSFSAFPGVTSPESSCARIGTVGTPAGKGRVQQFKIPSPPEGDNATITAEISPYRGPGTYRKASLAGVAPSVAVGSSSYNLRAAATVVTVTVDANGSGDLSFSQAAAAQSGRPALSGEIHWTCALKS